MPLLTTLLPACRPCKTDLDQHHHSMFIFGFADPLWPLTLFFPLLTAVLSKLVVPIHLHSYILPCFPQKAKEQNRQTSRNSSLTEIQVYYHQGSLILNSQLECPEPSCYSTWVWQTLRLQAVSDSLLKLTILPLIFPNTSIITLTISPSSLTVYHTNR